MYAIGSAAPLSPEERLERLRLLAQKYEIRPEFCVKLRQLESFEILFVCDDSGSMSQPIDSIINDKDPFAAAASSNQKTRWNELCHIVSIVSEVAACLDPNGIDVFFLNRPALHAIKSSGQVEEAFRYPPQGYTPIVDTLNSIIRDRKDLFSEKKVLLILATDGEPSDHLGNPKIPEFVSFVSAKPKNLFMTIIACTDDKESMKYLNKLDKKVARLDVVDDYRSERREIQKAKGNSYPFTFGDYVAKILLGSIDREVDALDEKQKCAIL